MRRQRRRIAAELRSASTICAVRGNRPLGAAPMAGQTQDAAGATPAAEEARCPRRERDELAERLKAAETPSEEGAAGESVDAEKMYELQRRFELAVEDMRQYKHRAEQLEEELRQKAESSPSPSASQSMSWGISEAANGPLRWRTTRRDSPPRQRGRPAPPLKGPCGSRTRWSPNEIAKSPN